MFYWTVGALALTTLVLWAADEWDRHRHPDDDPDDTYSEDLWQ